MLKRSQVLVLNRVKARRHRIHSLVVALATLGGLLILHLLRNPAS